MAILCSILLQGRSRPFMSGDEPHPPRPRLLSHFSRPLEENVTRVRPVSFGGVSAGSDSTSSEEEEGEESSTGSSYSDKVIRFLQQPYIFEQLQTRYEVSLSLRSASLISLGCGFVGRGFI